MFVPFRSRVVVVELPGRVVVRNVSRSLMRRRSSAPLFTALLVMPQAGMRTRVRRANGCIFLTACLFVANALAPARRRLNFFMCAWLYCLARRTKGRGLQCNDTEGV